MPRFLAPFVTLVAAFGLLPCACSSSDDAKPAPPTTKPLAGPYEPPAVDDPYVDVPFLQEVNHTTPEVEPGIGPLAAVVFPPASYTTFDRPTQVTPRGLVQRDAQGAPMILEIPQQTSDLIAAASTTSSLFVASDRVVYEVHPDTSSEEHAAPDGVIVTGLARGTAQVYVLTSEGLGWIPEGGPAVWSSGGLPATSALEAGGRLLVGGANRVDAFEIPVGNTLSAPVWSIGPQNGLEAIPVRAVLTDVTLPSPLDVVVIGDQEVQGFALSGSAPNAVDVPVFARDRVPLESPRAALSLADGGFVVTTAGGAYRMMERGSGPEWRVYNSERWLPSEDMNGLAADGVPDGAIYFATAAGLASVTASRVTLEQKLSPFVDRIAERHDRDGAVADSHLTRKGDLTSNIPWDSDNDGSWTSYWLVAECFRWRVTGDPAAKAHFDRSLDAMLRLRELTGTDHFVARAAIRKATCNFDDCEAPDDGEWFTSPDGAWWVKGDTSNDEVIAHVFMMGPAYDVCADESQRARIREHIGGIVGGIMDHGWQLVDVDGEVTKYGQFDPAYVNEGLAGPLGDGGVRSAEILAGLTLAHYLTGEQRFADGKRDLITRHHYADNTVRESEYAVRGGSGDGDEMATYAWFALLRYEPDAALRERWLDGWARTYSNLRKHQGAWWDMVNAAGGGASPDMRYAARWLRLAPVDMIRWDMHNSQRRDLIPAPAPYTGSMRSDGFILPYDERRCDRWNTDQFRVDGGMGGGIEMDGADVLAPYWMGRFYGFIEGSSGR